MRTEQEIKKVFDEMKNTCACDPSPEADALYVAHNVLDWVLGGDEWNWEELREECESGPRALSQARRR